VSISTNPDPQFCDLPIGVIPGSWVAERLSPDDEPDMQQGHPELDGRQRGLELARLHCESLDPDSPRARERLEDKLGVHRARLLVVALCARPEARHRSGLGLVA
jgi:hypothetical protein